MIKKYRLYAVQFKLNRREKKREKLSCVLEIDDDIEFNWIDHRGRTMIKHKLNEFLKDEYKLEDVQVMDPDTGEMVEFEGSELALLMSNA